MKSEPILSSGEDDATRAYLFRSRSDHALLAVTRDPSGANLPPPGDAGSWEAEGHFALGVREAMPVAIAPEPVLRGLMADGYFVWRSGGNPMGTSQ
jgi:hypothetical protein